jgi:hypothetical protein
MQVEYKSHDGQEILVVDGEINKPIIFKISRPKDEAGQERDQTNDAAENMRYAATFNLPHLTVQPYKPGGKAVIVGGAPSVKDYLTLLRELASNTNNAVFAINWSHTWLINHGIIPHGCLMFEVDAEPLALLETLHPEVTYYVCSHCHRSTFDNLQGFKTVLWHPTPASVPEQQARDEFYQKQIILGGGVSTFLRTLSLALALGYREFELFGVDSSYPADSPSTHIEGYPAMVNPVDDRLDVYVRNDQTGEVRYFRSVGYLAHQVEEFKEYCRLNHLLFRMRVHGDGMLPFVHRTMYPGNYHEDT